MCIYDHIGIYTSSDESVKSIKCATAQTVNERNWKISISIYILYACIYVIYCNRRSHSANVGLGHGHVLFFKICLKIYSYLITIIIIIIIAIIVYILIRNNKIWFITYKRYDSVCRSFLHIVPLVAFRSKRHWRWAHRHWNSAQNKMHVNSHR